jgi:hypothetical protein
MSVFVSWFASGGWVMWPLLGGGLLGNALGLAAVAAAFATPHRGVARALGVAALAGALLTLGIGGAATLHGLHAVAEAVALVDPSMQAALREVGTAEAYTPLEMGIASALLPLVLGFTAAARAWPAGPPGTAPR